MDIDPRLLTLADVVQDQVRACDAGNQDAFEAISKRWDTLAAELSAALLPTDAVERVARFIASEFGDGWDDPDMNDDPEGMQVIRNYWRAVATELLSALTQPAELSAALLPDGYVAVEAGDLEEYIYATQYVGDHLFKKWGYAEMNAKYLPALTQPAEPAEREGDNT